ncbi:hypothetical protein [Fluviispira vulneris]|uniref:hypothetical protein n=1 Tax=Fluviispira vulneris TaxID=2763012 RepID=UPI0016462CF8|nr:hypothetical protein [Fluviispira vulneris]
MKHISNKNGLNKVLKFTLSILLSMLIHGAFFLVLHFVYRNHKIFEKKPFENYQIITLNTFTTKNSSADQTINQSKPKNSNNKKINEFKKVKIKNANNNFVNNIITEKKDDSKASEIKDQVIKSQEKKFNVKISQNPFGYLKLPKQLLGQNLFPRKYEVLFKLTKSNTSYYDISIAKILPLQEERSYLDQVVKNALSAQLNDLSSEQKNDFYKIAINHAFAQNTTSQAQEIEIDTIRLVLEFHEPN